MAFRSLLNTVPFSSVHDIEQFYELWLKNQKTEKSDETASHCSKENGKQIHMPTDYAEVTVSHCSHACFRAYSLLQSLTVSAACLCLLSFFFCAFLPLA
jgi:hypothetical protein